MRIMPLSADVRKFSVSIAFSSLYIVLSLIPIGSFLIGGRGSFSLSLILPPVAGFFLGPVYGSLSMFIGALAWLFLSPGSFFGPLTPLVPMAGALASGFSRKRMSYLVFLYLTLFNVFFVARYSGFWWFIVPHVSASISSILLYFVKGRLNILLNTFSSTFAQHATGTFLFILLFNFKAELFYAMFFSMLYERTISTFGSFTLLLVLERYLGRVTFEGAK